MRAAAIIPARGGSRRIPGKNIRPFHGRPILHYSIETALRSGLFEAGVWVSTEDPVIARCAWEITGVKVHPRQKPLAEDDVGTNQVATAVMRELWPHPDARPDAICVIYPCAPLMCTGDLHDGQQALLDHAVPYVYSVGPDGQDAGQWYWCLASALDRGVDLEDPQTFHNRAHKLYLPAARVCDINTFEDWERAHRLYQAMVGAHR